MRGDELFRRLAVREPFTGMHPSVGAFFRDYLSGEKAVSFGDRFVINTHFPPFPSGAFDNLAEQTLFRNLWRHQPLRVPVLALLQCRQAAAGHDP